VYEFTRNYKKLNNDCINTLICSDSNYYVGAFAALFSVIDNTTCFDRIHFNFMIPIENNTTFSEKLVNFEHKVGKTLNKSIIYLDENILDQVFTETVCYNGGGHLLNMGNLSRLLIGEFMEYKKLLYIDSDSIVQDNIIEEIDGFELKYPLYADCANKHHTNSKKQIVIHMSSVIDCTYNWEKIIGVNISNDAPVYMGAPFVTNCLEWADVYRRMIQIIQIHNKTPNGIYKLFTMSIQNILFYKQIGNIRDIFPVLQDLGSHRKAWDNDDLTDHSVLDWSGMYKPWYSNGLYRKIWFYYDIMNLSQQYEEIVGNKDQIERFANK